MNNPECSLHFFHWLTKISLEIDGNEFHPGTQIPKTECKQKMMAMVLCNIDLWFLNLYQTLKEAFDGKFDNNQTTIIDKNGNFVVPCGELYSMYKNWYDENHPEDKMASTRKFSIIMASIVGAGKVVRAGNSVVKTYMSDIKTIETKLRIRYGCDPSTIVSDFGF